MKKLLLNRYIAGLLMALGITSLAYADNVVTIGQKSTLTEFNSPGTIPGPDPNNPLPMPVTLTSVTGGHAYIKMDAYPGNAGQQWTFTGATFDWDLQGLPFETVKDRKVKVTFDFNYTISASWTDSTGSANSGVSIPGFSNGFSDFVGFETGEKTSRSGHIVKTFEKDSSGKYITLDSLSKPLTVEIYGQAHSVTPWWNLPTEPAPGTGNTAINSSFSELTIKSITVQTVPEYFGVFVGIDSLNPENNIGGSGSRSTSDLLNTMTLNIPNFNRNNFEILTGDLDAGIFVTNDQISGSINSIKDKMAPGDIFVFYDSSHGYIGSRNGMHYMETGKLIDANGNIVVGPQGPVSTGISSLDLANDLHILDNKDVIKWVFIDACYSGGFWEEGLKSLNDIMFISSAPHDKVSAMDIDGTGYYTKALLDSFNSYIGNDGTKYLNADHDADQNLSKDELFEYINGYFDRNKPAWWDPIRQHYNYPVAYEREMGDAIIFEPSQWNPQLEHSADFPQVLIESQSTPVPAPSTVLLFGTGLAGLAAIGRRKRN